MGVDIRPAGLDRPAMDGGPCLREMRAPADLGHAHGKGGKKGVRGSFRDFLQNQRGYTEASNQVGAGITWRFSGDANGRFPASLGKGGSKPSQTTMPGSLPGKGGTRQERRGVSIPLTQGNWAARTW